MKVYLVSNYRGSVAFGSPEDAKAVSTLVGDKPDEHFKEVYLVQGDPGNLDGLDDFIDDLLAGVGGTDE